MAAYAAVITGVLQVRVVEIHHDKLAQTEKMTIHTILYKCLFSEVTIRVITKRDN